MVKYPRFPRQPFDPAWTAPILFQHAEGRVVLRIDHDRRQLPQAEFPVKVEFALTSIREDDSRETVHKELTVEYDPWRRNGETFIDRVVAIVPGSHLIRVAVVAIRDQQGALTESPSNVVAEAQIVVTRYDRLADVAPSSLSLERLGGEIEVSWSPVFGAEEYHLDWLHVDDYRRDRTDLAYDFRFDATRVATTALRYRISAIFEQGYLLARVRAVGRGGPDFELPVYGRWSSDGFDRGVVATYPAEQQLHVTEVHEGDSLNCQHVTNFAEEGKKEESVSYFDGSLRNRQVVSRLNTANEAIVGETIYDHQGRAAIQVLPTPTGEPAVEY